MNKEIKSEDLNWFALVIGCIPFVGNGYMFASLLIKIKNVRITGDLRK